MCQARAKPLPATGTAGRIALPRQQVPMVNLRMGSRSHEATLEARKFDER
jgi:hypothetical protein